MLELERLLLVGAPSRGRRMSAVGQEEAVATFLKSQRRPAAISQKRSFGYAGDFLRLTGRYAAVSSRWAQNSVGRQPANCGRSIIPASSHLNGCCTSQAATGPMHTTRPKPTLKHQTFGDRSGAVSGRWPGKLSERHIFHYSNSPTRPKGNFQAFRNEPLNAKN